MSGGATLALAETCGTKTGIKKEQLHVVGQEVASGVIGKYMGLKISPCPKHQECRKFVDPLIPLLLTFGAATLFPNREKE